MVLNADGSDLHLALEKFEGLHDATWSPDGSRISLWSYETDGSNGIRTVGPDGSNPKMVTSDSAGSYHDTAPAWRP